MKAKLLAAGASLAISLVAAQAANAGAVVLNFVGLQNNEAVGNFYDGGTGGGGSGPGPNYGITFGPDSLALIDDADGGSGNFSNAPSDTVLYFVGGPGDVMDIAAGFTGGFSFDYADQVGFTGSVTVWSGLDGTGTQLASLSLPSTPSPYSVFSPIGVNFAGTAESVVFSGSANFIAFDDITLGSSTAGGGVPEPMTWALLLAGFAGIGAAMRVARRRVPAPAN